MNNQTKKENIDPTFSFHYRNYRIPSWEIEERLGLPKNSLSQNQLNQITDSLHIDTCEIVELILTNIEIEFSGIFDDEVN